MAFSFRAGTNWCHDFPKLARESGFYFNMHSARVRVDWNRISTIDIDRLIRERDFQTIDENVNNVIDYYLESEYDVKILDPNFVKLFRLAQLAVEYLLYCKQYLDQSVVILKEELKYKLEENVKLKEDIRSQQILIKELKEKNKEKKNHPDVTLESRGEIHKCPHCPKTFITAAFANAHVLRRHSNIDGMNISPVHEEYKAETEKLHIEIKNLKERLNQTERVIRNESSKINSQHETPTKDKPKEITDSTTNDSYRKCHEEISNLKSMLFSEISNIKRKENSLATQQENETINENIKELIKQQESEIERLKNQLQENFTVSTNEVQSKLVKQEEYWKSKLEKLEGQHRNDIENLFAQLKVTQESATRMKSDYEDKVNFLEKQSIDQSKLLAAQTEQLNNLTQGIRDYQEKHQRHTIERESNLDKKKMKPQSNDDSFDSEISHKSKKSKFSKDPKQFISNFKSKTSYSKLISSNKGKDSNEPPAAQASTSASLKDKIMSRGLRAGGSSTAIGKTENSTSHRQTTKTNKEYSSLDEVDKSTDTASETESVTEEDSDEEKTSVSDDSRTESTNDNSSEKEEKLPETRVKKRKSESHVCSKEVVLESFERKLRDLGIDPEWTGIPAVSYKQKMDTVKHHQNISSKSFPSYDFTRKKILEEISKRLSVSQKSLNEKQPDKKSIFKNVKTKAMRALNEFKIQKGNETSTSVASSKNSSPKESESRRKFSFELLPKKPGHKDIQEIKRQARLDTVIKKEKRPKKEEIIKKEESPKVSLPKESPRPLQTTEVTIEQPKRLQRSYMTIEDFMKDVDSSPKPEKSSSKLTSTPSRSVNNPPKETYNTLASDSDGQVPKQDALWALASPKNSKSVLKSTNNASNASIKKKVLFDLEKEEDSEKNLMRPPTSEFPALGVLKEPNDSDWNASSVSEDIMPEEKDDIISIEKTESTENIHLKTSQSEKIAEISRRIQEKLDASRRKPAGSIEAMFSAKNSSTNEEIEASSRRSSSDRLSTIMESLTSQTESKSRSSIEQVPRPAPRRQL